MVVTASSGCDAFSTISGVVDESVDITYILEYYVYLIQSWSTRRRIEIKSSYLSFSFELSLQVKTCSILRLVACFILQN